MQITWLETLIKGLLDSEVSIEKPQFVKRKEVLKFEAPLPGKRPKGAIPNH